ncbi:MAG: DsbA family protein [Planctomycetes bacterium]|nr:DsbA family protein [Planctomycetota bacterium]MBI3834606.1 DsbA family protein [Planctomycetota bacterium]
MTKRMLGLFIVAGAGMLCSTWALADAKSDKGVAATIGDKPVTLEELDVKILKGNMKLAQQLYDARKAALDELILEKALGDESKAAGTTTDQLMKKKIQEKVTPPTDAEVEAYFNANQGRMQGKPLTEMAPQIKSMLSSQKEADVKGKLLTELKSKANVKVMLEVPRIEVAVGPTDPSKGPKDARVTVIEFSDFQCPFCSRGAATFKQIHEVYGDKVRIVFREFPLGMHQRAQPAAEAAECANEQGKFWEYHDKLFGNQQKLADEDFNKYAEEVGLNVEQFKACYSTGKFKADVQKDVAEGSKAGVTGTPAFFVNGRFVSGAQPLETFKTMIDEELSR